MTRGCRAKCQPARYKLFFAHRSTTGERERERGFTESEDAALLHNRFCVYKYIYIYISYNIYCLDPTRPVKSFSFLNKPVEN